MSVVHGGAGPRLAANVAGLILFRTVPCAARPLGDVPLAVDEALLAGFSQQWLAHL